MFIYARALRYFRPYLWPTLGGVVLTFVAIIVNSLKPWPFKYIVDGVLPSDATHGTEEARAFIRHWFGSAPLEQVAFWLCLILVIVSVLGGLITLVSNYLFIRVGLNALLRLRTDLYACLQSLPLKYHDSRRSSDSSFRVAYDSQSIQTIYNRGFATILSSFVMLIWTFGIMVWMNWPLALTSLAVLPFVTFAIGYFADRVRRQSTTIQERESDLLALTQEGISQIRMVHAFGRESFELRQFRKRAARSLEAGLRFNITSIVSSLVVGSLMATGTALMYYVGARQVLAGALTLGDLTVFAAYLLMLYQPMEQLSYTAWAMEGAAAAAARCFEVLDREDDVPDAPHAKPIEKVRGEISFRDVSFGYSHDRLILRDINLSIAAGESVAFVGGTGAGKSTLLSLVPRFYDPTSGAVLIDGRNLRDLTKKSVRLQIGMVLAGYDPLLNDYQGKHSLWPARGDRRTDHRGCPASSSLRFYHGHAPWVRQRGGRKRWPSERGSTTAHRDRPSFSQECSYPSAG